jgi:hypothetical protein
MKILKRLSIPALGLLLAGCEGTRAAKYTPLPYGEEDSTLEILGKTLVNLPAWTGEGIGFTAIAAVFAGFFLGILWIQAGAPGAPGSR